MGSENITNPTSQNPLSVNYISPIVQQPTSNNSPIAPTEKLTVKNLFIAFLFATVVYFAFQGTIYVLTTLVLALNLVNFLIVFSVIPYLSYFFVGLVFGRSLPKAGWIFGGVWSLLATIFMVVSILIAKAQMGPAGINNQTITYGINFSPENILHFAGIILLPVIGGFAGEVWRKKTASDQDTSGKSLKYTILFLVLLIPAIFGGYTFFINTFYSSLPSNPLSSKQIGKTTTGQIQSGPGLFAAKTNNVVRKSDLGNLSMVFKAYRELNRKNHPEITSEPQKIASDGFDICMLANDEIGATAGVSINYLPLDPALNNSPTKPHPLCENNSTYDTGYTVVANSDGTITVSAPFAELNEKISTTI